MAVEGGPEPKPVTEPEPKPPAIEAPKTEEPVPQLAEVATKPNLESMVKDQVRQAMDSLQQREAPAKAPPPEPKPAEPKPDEPEDLTGWTEDEIEELELARYAEQAKPDQYKNQAAKLKKWRNDLDAYITKARADNPDRTFDSEDKDFTNWVEKNQPRYAPGEKRKLQRSMIEEAAAARAERAASEKMQATNRKLHELEALPKVEKSLNAYHQRVASLLEDPEHGGHEMLSKVIKRVKEIGIEAAAKELPQHVRTVMDTYQHGQNMVKEFLALEYGLTEFNPQKPAPAHQWLWNFVRRQDEFTTKQPEANRTREVMVEGVPVKQTFMPSMEYRSLAAKDPAKAMQHWTYGTEDYQKMLEINTKWAAAARIKQLEEELAAAGYVRKEPEPAPKAEADNGKAETNGKPTAKPPAKDPKPIKAPSAATTPSLGAASGSPPQNGQVFSEREMKWLGVK